MLLLMLMLLLACQLRNFSFFLFFSFPAGFKTGRGGRVRFYTKLFFFFSFPSLFFFTCSIMLPSLLLHLGGGGGGLSGLCHNSSCSSASSFLVIRQDPTSRRRRKKKEEEEAEKDLFQQLVEDIQISSFLSPLRTVCMYIYTLCNRASFFGRTQQRVYRNDAGRWPPLGHSKNPPTLYLSIYSPLLSLVFPV